MRGRHQLVDTREMRVGPLRCGLALGRVRAAVLVLLAALAVALAGAVLADTDVSASTGIPARAGSGSPALASVERRCRTVRVKLKRNGKVVKRNGKPVLRRVRRCTKVPSPGCRFVKVKKRTKSGKVVKRNGKPVYIKVERCPPKPKPGPGPGPTPQPGPGPGPAPGPSPAPPSDLANRVLALSQHVPGNIDLFTSVFLPSATEGLYPAGVAMAPVDGTPPTEDVVRAQLTAYLNRWFDNDSARVTEALALFDADAVKTLIADPTLRAAFAAMKGTLLEPTIDHLLTSGLFSEVRWGGLPNTVVAGVCCSPRIIAVNRRHEGDRFEYLIGVMGHEILHDDTGTPQAEEAINTALTAMTQMQVLSKSPELARGGTELARLINDGALLFINSREAGSPNGEIYAPTGLGVAPGSPRDTADLWTFINGAGFSPAPEPLRTILQNVFAPGTSIPATLNFDQATAELFANLDDNWLSDTQRAQISVLLQLVTVDEIAQATGLSQQQIIDTLGLQPYLDAIGG